MRHKHLWKMSHLERNQWTGGQHVAHLLSMMWLQHWQSIHVCARGTSRHTSSSQWHYSASRPVLIVPLVPLKVMQTVGHRPETFHPHHLQLRRILWTNSQGHTEAAGGAFHLQKVESTLNFPFVSDTAHRDPPGLVVALPLINLPLDSPNDVTVGTGLPQRTAGTIINKLCASAWGVRRWLLLD